MMTARRFFSATILTAALALPAQAYDPFITHTQMTVFATEKSVIYTDPMVMLSLGLQPADKQRFTYRGRIGMWALGTTAYELSDFIAEGAFDEDLGKKPVNHFYDPHFDRPLTILGVPAGRRSYHWMLEDEGQITFPVTQDFSVVDARQFLIRGLTFNEGSPAQSSEARGSALGSMFLSLGHLVHHMQDMAQPQHVRNDDHLDMLPLFGLNPFYNPSRYEAYTALRDFYTAPLAAAATPVFPGSNDFRTMRDFWFNPAQSGIAQLTNRQFVSHGTNFFIRNGQANTGGYILPQPGATTDLTLDVLFGETGETVPPGIQTVCGTAGADCTITMYSTVTSQRASTLSIFDQDLVARGLIVTYLPGEIPIPVGYQSERLFALNRFNFDDAHMTLIGRAVSYSAGAINHFFRGKLDITAPASGPFAVVDHSTGNGFTKIRATVRNATTGEALSNGFIRAIAKFHRNGCYQADLSGEFTVSGGQLVTPCPNYRSAESHIRLTAEEAASFAAGESKEMTFTFSEAIPLDATDLILQVLFRGTVGTETETFALGAFDLSEPTFVAIMNATDVFELSAGGFYYWRDIIKPENIANPPYSVVDIDGNHEYNSPPDVNVVGGDISYEVSVNGKKVADVTLLPQGRFARFATLVSPFGFQLTLIARGNGFNSISSYNFPAKNQQFDPASGSYLVSPVAKLRNHTLQWDSVSFFHFFPTTGAPLNVMPLSKETDATVLFAAQMLPNALQSTPFEQLLETSPGGEPPGSRSQEVGGSAPMPLPVSP